jgi:hypothetical protein
MFVPVHAFEILNTENTEDHGEPREFFMLERQAVTERIIGFAIEVHRTVGPGLPESGGRRVCGPGTGPCRHRIRSPGHRAPHLQKRNDPTGLSPTS